MSGTWPPPPAVEDVHEIATEPDGYEDMPSLEQAAAPQAEAAPDSGPPAMPSAQPLQSSQATPGVPTLTLPTHWGPPPAGVSPEFLISYYTASGLTQEALNSVPPPPFFMINQQINAATVSPPGFTIENSPFQQANSGLSPTILPWLPSNFPAIFAGLSGPAAGDHADDVWEDVPGDTDEADDDEMPALGNGNPLTTSPPVGLQAHMMASFAEFMAAMGGPDDQPFPNAPNGSDPPASSSEMPGGLLAALQHGAWTSSAAPATDLNGTTQNGATSAGPAMLSAFPVHMNFIVGTQTIFTPGAALHSGSFTANNPEELAAETAAAGADILDPTTGEVYPELHAHFWQSGGPLPDGSLSIAVGSVGVPPTAAESLTSMGFTTTSVSLANAATMFDPLAITFGSISLHHLRAAARPRFDAAAFVENLDRVEISDIPAEDMRCPYCWLPFSTTDEDDPNFVFIPDPDDPPEIAARQITFRELLPFCADRADNDPVRTPCGHLFGRGCLVETLEKVDTLCPTCRKDLRPQPETPKVEV
ncbi:hypothetical protein HBI12_235140 [Parastagonospora nodorum]|nr:hypothetical protein HBI12_235140 [Parastagonospora nodorum]